MNTTENRNNEENEGVKPMIDIKNGVVEFNGIVVTKNSSPDNLKRLPEGILTWSTSKRFGGDFFVINEPVVAGGVSMRVSIDFFPRRPIPKIECLPYGATSCEEMFDLSHKWLENALGRKVETVSQILIEESEKMRIYAAVHYCQKDGMKSGGEIQIQFI